MMAILMQIVFFLLKWYDKITIKNLPIIKSARVKCSFPVGLAAPKKVPITAQTRPMNEINKINQRIDKPVHVKQDLDVLVSTSLSREHPDRR